MEPFKTESVDDSGRTGLSIPGSEPQGEANSAKYADTASPAKYRVTYAGIGTNGKEVVLNLMDCGPALNNEFKHYLDYCFLGTPYDLDPLRAASLEFFDSKSTGLEVFFDNFTEPWHWFIRRGLHQKAQAVWEISTRIAEEWERGASNRHVHKGTPFYFWAGTCIEAGDVEKGFVLMHRALQEDIDASEGRLPDPPTPALMFVGLDPYKPNQFFKPMVEDLADFVKTLLKGYRDRTGSKLDLVQLRERFLSVTDLENEAFFFVGAIARIKRLQQFGNSGWTTSLYGAMLAANALSNLCLIVENLLDRKFKCTKLYDLMKGFALANKLIAKQEHMGELASEIGANLTGDHYPLVNKEFKYSDGLVPNERMIDLLITHKLRNFGAHELEGKSVIQSHIGEFAQAIANAIFGVIEFSY